jgi:hypothetical protein
VGRLREVPRIEDVDGVDEDAPDLARDRVLLVHRRIDATDEVARRRQHHVVDAGLYRLRHDTLRDLEDLVVVVRDLDVGEVAVRSQREAQHAGVALVDLAGPGDLGVEAPEVGAVGHRIGRDVLRVGHEFVFLTGEASCRRPEAWS